MKHLSFSGTEWEPLFLNTDDADGRNIDSIAFLKGWTVNRDIGVMEPDRKRYISNCEPIRVGRGSSVSLCRSGYSYKLYFYTPEIEKIWISTSNQQEDSSWIRYIKDESVLEWTEGRTVVKRDGYVRIVLKKNDGKRFVPEETGNLLCIEITKPEEDDVASVFDDEISDTVSKVRAMKDTGDTVLFIAADSHFAVNGTWNHTIQNMKRVSEAVEPAALIHLGDLTDGRLPIYVTKQYAARMIRDLESVSRNCFVCVGNHDWNINDRWYDMLKEEECRKLYSHGKKWESFDIPDGKLRLFILNSFDPSGSSPEEQYGFAREELRWVRKGLKTMPGDYSALFFSHLTLFPEQHRWSKGIRGSDELLEILNRANRKNVRVLGYICGHNHSDGIDCSQSFPVISLASNKLESASGDPNGHKHEDKFARSLNMPGEDLWDVLAIDKNEQRLKFVRFGAGEDRTADAGVTRKKYFDE